MVDLVGSLGQWGAYTDWELGSYDAYPIKPAPLVLAQVRYYDPKLARFTSRDPSADGMNWYAYAENNPVTNKDPDGMSYISDVGDVFKGYGDVVNPVNMYKGIASLYEVGKNGGGLAAGQALAQGIAYSLTAWATTSDPREFGQSFGTVLTTAAAIAVPYAKAGSVAGTGAGAGSAATTALGSKALEYKVSSVKQAVHTSGKLSTGKSQFLFGVDADTTVLRAARYADAHNLWRGSDLSQARIPCNEPVGVVAGSGYLTHWLKVSRSGTGYVHGWPCAPK